MLTGRAYLVSKAFTLSLLVVREDTKGEISSSLHFSLAPNKTVSRSAMVRGKLSSANLLITAGVFSSSTKTRPCRWERSVWTPSGTACNGHHTQFRSDWREVVAVMRTTPRVQLHQLTQFRRRRQLLLPVTPTPHPTPPPSLYTIIYTFCHISRNSDNT